MAPGSSLTPALYQASSAHVSLFRDPSDSDSSSIEPSDSPSIYVTFKVLQLVNAFRRRVTRKHTAAQATTKKVSTGTTTADDFCQDFERQAFDEIDRYLGRKTRHPLSKRAKATGERVGRCPTVATEDTNDKPAGKSIEQLLERLDRPISFGEDSIHTIAKSDHLFLQRQGDLSIDRLSARELCELLVTVKDLLKHLQVLGGNPDIWEGNGLFDCDIDPDHTANLEHLLLRIQGELLRLLVASLVELVHRHVSDCQKDQSKRSEEWFFEYPDARHPLSTTWPWSIKPSLAVIWGVCWMFYPPSFDDNGNLVNERGEIEVPAEQVIAFYRSQGLLPPEQQRQQHVESRAQQQQQMFATATPRQAFAQSHWPSGNQSSPSVKMESGSTPPQTSSVPRGLTRTSLSHSPQHHPSHQAGTPLQQVPHTTSGIAGAHTNNLTAFATQPPSTYLQESAWPLPQDNFQDFSFQGAYNSTAAVGAQWNQGISLSYPGPQPHSHYQTRPIGQATTLPPRSRHPSTPAIITTDLSFPQQPQEYNHYSATSVSTNSSFQLQETASRPTYRNQQFDRGRLSPHSPYMADTLPPPDMREMQTTTPPRSPHEMVLGEQMNRKRSHSQISTGQPFSQADLDQLQQHAADGGHFQQVDGSHHGSQVGDDAFEPGLEPGRMHVDRPDPLMNENRKYMCNFQGEECVQLTFDRKCEWSKHMDKHDRPYRCPDPGCAKLQGFTYSGGLLRHEREVHGKHGGPKAQLMCPFTDCKRHSGKGFTRKENLNEHVRRVHQNREQPSQQPSQPQPDFSKDDTAFEALAGAARAMEEAGDTPASAARVSEAVMVEDPELHSPAAKRRRNMPPPGASERSASEDVEDLRRQIEQLQQENAQKDQRLLDMERVIAELDRRVQEQQRSQNQWSEQQQAAAAAAQAIASAAQQA